MAWFRRNKNKDNASEPPKPFTIDEANQFILNIIHAKPYAGLMKQLKLLLEKQDNIFPRVTDETPQAKDMRQEALISAAVNNLHEQHGPRFMLNEEAEQIFSYVGGELEAMNKGTEYGRWAASSRRPKTPPQSGIT